MAERKTVSVEILGKSYAIRGEADPDYTRGLAQFVEEQMRKVAAQSSAVDTQKIAILAALNIANDLFQARRQEQEKEAEWDRRADALLQMVEKAG
ncbi:MAG: cell division protein ZapA [Nitrospinota bacterium]